jgi:DNA-binding transcriptional ArsR family regulator
VSEIRFDVADVVDVRFVISPIWETVRSLYALADPGRHAAHLPWVRGVRAAAQSMPGHLALLTGIARPGAWLPDFLTPPPPGPLVELDEELSTVLATPPGVVAADLAASGAHRPLTREARTVADDPAAMLPRLVDAVRAWHDTAIRSHWPQMRALLEADIAHRSRQLTEGGARLLFDTLHPTVRWSGDRLVSTDPWDVRIDLRGRGLPLMPSVFNDKRVLWAVRESSQPVAVYPARAVATLWEGREPSVAGLGGVLGAARARLLVLVCRPASTTELARQVGLSPAAVSQHLHALHAAGLVTRGRHGRSVLYLVAEPGSVLLAANGVHP